MLTAQQVADARAAAIAAGFPNPGPATIAFYAFNPAADAAAVIAGLQAIAPAVSTDQVNSDIAAMNAEAQGNTTSAQVIGTLTEIGNVVLPIAEGAAGIVAPLILALLLLTGSVFGSTAQTEIYFTQAAQAVTPQAAIIAAIHSAKKTISIQEYQLTASEIVDALADACKRGVKVTALLDRSLGFPLHDGPKKIHDAGADVRFDCCHEIAHNKLAVIDLGAANAVAFGGSYNWTDNAEHHNAENLTVFHGPDIIALVQANIERHWSEPKTLNWNAMLAYVKDHDKNDH